jgi:hypothetical protein
MLQQGTRIEVNQYIIDLMFEKVVYRFTCCGKVSE